MKIDKSKLIFKPRFTPLICVTHRCNLNCLYCYQKHDKSKMTLDTAKRVIDCIFDVIPDETVVAEIGFMGGEPLLEFDLIKEIVEYTCSNKKQNKFIFFATTNGTLINPEMKNWLKTRKDVFVLGLSLDGSKETQDYNRDKSFDKIDIEFFLKNYPEQTVKMTLSEYSLPRLAENIKFIHSCGFKSISGANLAEMNFDWSKDDYIKLLVPQLKELVEFYLENDNLNNQMFTKKIHLCEVNKNNKNIDKWCGIGTGTPFFDVDGKVYPCPYFTQMTFSENVLSEIDKIDFSNNENFLDDCFNACYIYPMCPTCAGVNYLVNKSLKKRDKRRCKIQKLIALFLADLRAKQIVKNPKLFDDVTLYRTIEAIKQIRLQYMPEFEKFL